MKYHILYWDTQEMPRGGKSRVLRYAIYDSERSLINEFFHKFDREIVDIERIKEG